MATRTAVDGQIAPRGMKQTWTGLLNGDDGSWIEGHGYPDKSIQVFGNFGAGGELTVEGSNDGGTTAAVLKDYAGNALTITAAGIYLIVQNTEKLRPNITAGDGATNLTAIVVGAR